MASIASVTGRRVWDSRGRPTVEATLTLDNGLQGRAMAPAGASRGSREALDLRDGGQHLRGLDVSEALNRINGPIAGALTGLQVADQLAIDHAMLQLDSSALKSTLGGNAMVAVSLAALHAASANAALPLWQYIAEKYAQLASLPLPEIQIFGGGAHAGKRVDIQDFMVMVPGASDLEEVMEITSEVYFAAGDIMSRTGRQAGVADEGGWWPVFSSNEEALETLVQAIELAGEKPGERVVISLDIAASEFGHQGRYRLALDNRELSSDEFAELLGRWLDDYPIVSIEDPLGEDDSDGMQFFTQRHGGRVQIIGDDFLVTNPAIVKRAVNDQSCNAVLLKVNQIGTVSEAMDTFLAAKQAGWGVVVSARSGETEDTSISHLAVGLGSGQLKVGSFQRSERMAKWNECLRIQDVLGKQAFVGGAPLRDTWWGKARQPG